MSDKVLEIKNLKKYYGKAKAVEDVSFSINKGEIYGFIGPNGAGKSTTIRTIMGFINKNGGNIYINGEEIDYNNTNFKRIIGYVPSEINLYSDMTIKQIFDFHESFYTDDLSKRRKELSKLLKVDENKKIEDLSLGNLKKVGIILALMHNPKILILDEPTSGLDPIMQNILHNLLLEEKKKGVTILYSSHVLSEISSVCDRVGFIKDGKIIKEDTINNIKKDNLTYLTIVSKDNNKIKKELDLKVVEEETDKIKLINDLDFNTLINKLTKYKIDKILIEDIPLEDLFINYYK